MSNDPLALSGIGAGLPQEAEFDAVYAAVTATERGRWFLTEYSSRNRHADINSLVSAIARIEAVVRGDTIGSERSRAPDIHGATERIADIAIGLRDRAADPALCDALDAAVRELCAAVGNGAANHAAKGAATRAAAIAAVPPIDEGLPSPTGGFDPVLPDSNEFARAATALAASLSTLADDAETACEVQSTTSPAIIRLDDDQHGCAPQPVEPAKQTPRWYIAPPDFVLHPSRREADAGVIESAGPSGQMHSPPPQAQLLPDPQDDPADLFESAPGRAGILPQSPPAPTPPAASAPVHATSTPADVLQVMPNPPPQSPAGPTVRPMPRPVPVSPLAALRALSEEELIALFG